jgi:hypothetical protein
MRPDPQRRLAPPKELLPLDVGWHSFPLSEVALTAKRSALQEHRTQLPLVGRFLRSFLGGSELFSRWPVVPWRTGETLELRHPVRDRFGRAWCSGVDITALELERRGERARLNVRLRGRPQPWARYVLSWSALPNGDADLAPQRAWFEGAALRAGKRFGVELDSEALASGVLFLGAEVWCGALLDRTPWRVVRVL